MESDVLKIQLIQPNTFLGNVSANLSNIDKLLKLSAQQSNLIILPEMFSTGFSMKPELFAEPENGEAVNWLCKTAQAHNAAIIASVMIADGGKYFNRAFFVFPDGKYLCYNKRHLFSYGGEDKKFTAGGERTVVGYLGWRICLQICYDLRFPVWSRNKNDYDFLVYIASWPNARQKAWSLLPVARAIENQSYVACVNRVGSDKTGSYSGETKMLDALGNVVAESNLNEENVVSCEISLSKLNEIRAQFPFAADADNFELS